MKTINYFILLCFLFIILGLASCVKDNDDINRKGKLSDSKTNIFGEISEPEITNNTRTVSDEYSKEYAGFEDAASTGGSSTSAGTWGGGEPVNGQDNLQAGIVTAGEWNDLENWDFWEGLKNNQEYYEDINDWNLQSIKRYSFKITDNSDNPVCNAQVLLIRDQLVIWEAKSDNKGQAELWASSTDENLWAKIVYNDVSYPIEKVYEYGQGLNNFQISDNSIEMNSADILFVVDATGSMSDEINYLKTELSDVISRVQSNNTFLEMRLGSVFYRDEGDEYVTKPFSFTTNANELLTFINEQNADGGGDFPEAVHTALDLAINQMTWDKDSKARLLFLLLDAPPHYTQEVSDKIQSLLVKASEEGIKIIPVTASGIDKATEFLMRAFSIITHGTYVFITDDSGVGGDHLEPTIGEYSIEKLNDLMVRLINENIE